MVATVLQFIEAINAHDVNALCELMTEGHTFVDSQGKTERSRERMRNAWLSYLGMFPDYSISVDQTFADSDTVVVLGIAQGTYYVAGGLVDENHWEIPAAWRAKVHNGLVSEWQVYADNEPVVRLIEAATKD